jgi:hypothetical protein
VAGRAGDWLCECMHACSGGGRAIELPLGPPGVAVPQITKPIKTVHRSYLVEALAGTHGRVCGGVGAAHHLQELDIVDGGGGLGGCRKSRQEGRTEAGRSGR